MTPGTQEDASTAIGWPPLDALRARVDSVLLAFLDRCREELAELDPAAVLLTEELRRLVRAGGKRIRPAFCYFGHLAAGGVDREEIVRASAALELLHTFALVHDDVMDQSEARRGVPTVHERLAGEGIGPRSPADRERFGRSAAILVGDLAAVLADRLLAESGFAPVVLGPATRRYDRMRVEMAAGQLLDLVGDGVVDRDRVRHVSTLKTGSYTIEGPLAIGAILAGGSPEVLAVLERFGEPLGEAYQLRDDLLDLADDQLSGSAPFGPDDVNRLVDRATAALDPAILAVGTAETLSTLADLVAMR